jgi:hypothetical protein
MFFGMPFDILVIIVAFATLFSWLLYFGKSAGVTLFLSLFISYFLGTISPLPTLLMGNLGAATDKNLVHIGFFVVSSLLFFFALRRVISAVFSWNQ